MRLSRTLVLVLLAGGAAVLVVVLAVAGLRSAGDTLSRGSCETTKGVVAQTVPALAPRFALAELNYVCRRNLAAVASDQVYMSFSSARDYPSSGALVRAVRARLIAAGWAARPGSARRLSLRRDGASYSAVVTASSIAPALAIVRLRKAKPTDDEGASDVASPIPEKHLSDAQRLRYAPMRVFVPAYVPAGYTSWGNLFIVELDDVQVALQGGGEVAPVLRSSVPPKDFSTRECDRFTLESKGDRCRLFGTTRSGLRVYIARDDSAADGLAANAVAVVHGTLVTLLNAHRPDVKPPVSRADVMRIFDSLHARNTPARR